jgi:hypothetical protein
MLLTYIHNHKLFIQFDRVINKGLIYITGDNEFEETKKVNNSNFEIIALPEKIKNIKITINVGKTRIIRTIKIE